MTRTAPTRRRTRTSARLAALLTLTAVGLLGGALAAQADATGSSSTASGSGSLGGLSATIDTTYQCQLETGEIGGTVTATVANNGTSAQDVTLKLWSGSLTASYPYPPRVFTVPAGSSAELSTGYSMYDPNGGFILTSTDGTIATLDIHCTTPSPSPSPTDTSSPEPSPTPTETATPEPAPTLIATDSPALAPSGPTATAPTASLSTHTALQGGQLTVTGSGFTANEPLELWLHSTPVKLTTLTANADGTFTQVVTIPTGTALGSHQIEVRGTTSGSLTLNLTVTDTLAATGLDPAASVGVGIGGGALLLTGIAVTVMAARRRRA
ncbi:hypothetical protein [Microbacterium sp. SORGH_AS_0888]|uniref:hypothetical protein n=1 Tax=Microbacterium sp. SORGH_AS_0888 TaxID=3041791 RepID=UPI0027831C57|nr:hypothetical protein [Microbacterium sp. SORGH_AS_0888]MDQ1131030.1 hypothetical protein [Microbacterium sp. SORGH_AS_0888]